MKSSFGRWIGVLGAALAVTLSATGCVSRGVEFTTTNGPEEFSPYESPTTTGTPTPGTPATATVSKVSVQYPADWYVVPTGSLGRDWEWGAQSLPGATPRGTLAVGQQAGKMAAIGEDILNAERARTNWKLRNRKPLKIGTTKALRIDSGFLLQGQDYQFTRVLVQESTSSTVIVQIAAPAPLDTGLIADLIDGIAVI